MAQAKWIAFVSLQANAHWRMAHNPTFGVLTAGAWARILAVQIDASEIAGTLCIIDTLWLTIWWTSEIIWQTRT